MDVPVVTDDRYTPSMVEGWEREAEDTVDVGLLASPGHLHASRVLVEHKLVIRKGDTIMRLLQRAGVPANQAALAIGALRPLYNLRRIRVGQKLTVTTFEGDQALGNRRLFLHKADLETGLDTSVSVERKADGFVAREVETPTEVRLVRVDGEIENSLYIAAEKAGMPASVLLQLVRAYSWDVDFQREIHAGDSFDVAWETVHTPDGEFLGDREMVYGSLTLKEKKLELFRFESRHGTNYFDRNGVGARKPLLRTPIDGARLSSRYGKRRHPILGYTRMHRGIDFAARPGTPIYAAGDGTVAYAGRNGAYGLYIRIRHNSRYQTAYAHMRALRRGVRRGTRVSQGQVIGYVGSTGLSTGPHLHYEILVGGRQVNPLSVSLPPNVRLKGKDLVAFQAYCGALERRLARIADTDWADAGTR